MITENYKIGFVEKCLEAGLDEEQTSEFLKKATFATGFNHPSFLEGFEEIHGQGSAKKLSALEKSNVVEKALAGMLESQK